MLLSFIAFERMAKIIPYNFFKCWNRYGVDEGVDTAIDTKQNRNCEIHSLYDMSFHLLKKITKFYNIVNELTVDQENNTIIIEYLILFKVVTVGIPESQIEY